MSRQLSKQLLAYSFQWKAWKNSVFLVLFPHVGVVNICMKEKYDTKAKTKHKSIVFWSTDFRRGAFDAWMKYTLKK